MPEQLSQDLLDIADSATRFANETLLPLMAKYQAGELTEHGARAKVVEGAKRAGLFHLRQPDSVGGGSASTLALAVLRDTLASHNPEWLSDVFGPGPGILAQVQEPLLSSHLKPMLAGQRRAGFAFTEPADAPRYTTATRTGDDVLLNGQKSYVTQGNEVDFLNVLADVEDEGRAFVVVDTSLAGVIVERVFTTLAGSQHAAFRFDNVRLPSSHIVGMPGQGMSKAMRQIGDTRITMAAEAVGLGRWVLHYLTKRIRAAEAAHGMKETVRLRYGDLRIKLYAARSAVYRAARVADSGNNAVNEGIAAKAFATETLSEIVDTAMQLTGGSALVSDHPLARLYQTTRVLRVAEGLTDVLRLNIARGALELDRGTL